MKISFPVMGTGVSKQSALTPEDKVAFEQSRKIEKELAKSQEEEAKTIKLLLLGINFNYF